VILYSSFHHRAQNPLFFPHKSVGRGPPLSIPERQVHFQFFSSCTSSIFSFSRGYTHPHAGFHFKIYPFGPGRARCVLVWAPSQQAAGSLSLPPFEFIPVWATVFESFSRCRVRWTPSLFPEVPPLVKLGNYPFSFIEFAYQMPPHSVALPRFPKMGSLLTKVSRFTSQNAPATELFPPVIHFLRRETFEFALWNRLPTLYDFSFPLHLSRGARPSTIPILARAVCIREHHFVPLSRTFHLDKITDFEH